MALRRLQGYPGVPGPVVTVVLDGVGWSDREEGNAVRAARTPTLDRLWTGCRHTLLRAHGTAVGMPSDADMGNSEVGHNAMGAGRVFAQGASLVNQAIASGRIWESDAWKAIVARVGGGRGTLHLLGLVSDGNVHSHVDHLRALVRAARDAGIRRVRVHALLDGRDVPATSALEYVEPLEAFLRDLSSPTFDARIASGGGRQAITMDRYEANWGLVERGWRTHVLGEGPTFPSASAAIRALRAQHPGTIDQDLPPFVVVEDGRPVGTIEDGDAVVFFNFRGDRALEMSRAFEEDDFPAFDRRRRPDVLYAGMLEYDGDRHVPRHFLVAPPAIPHPSGELLAQAGVTTLAVAETQKFGHVTYFWNGNRSGRFDPRLETFVEVPSDQVPFEQRPWMKAAEVTDEVVRRLGAGGHRNVRVNYANGDMVGHTGHFEATVLAIEAIDLCLARLLAAVEAADGVLLLTADHGNAEEMFELDPKTGEVRREPDGRPKARTSHSLNPVPFIVFDPHGHVPGDLHEAPEGHPFGLANLTATILVLLGFEPPAAWEPPLLGPGSGGAPRPPVP